MEAYWHRDAGGRPVEEMLQRFDDAAVLVAYNGRAFDMRVLRRYYGEGAEADARWKAHCQKLIDPMEAVVGVAKRRVRMEAVARANGHGGKNGDGRRAPEMYARGQLEQLRRYCERDVELLALLVVQAEMRVPGGARTAAASVRRWVTAEGGEKEASDDGSGSRQEEGRRREDGGGVESNATQARCGRSGSAATQKRGQRTQTTEKDADNREKRRRREEDAGMHAGSRSGDEEAETVGKRPAAGRQAGFYGGSRRRARRPDRRVAWVEKARQARRVELRTAIRVGTATVRRITQDRYDVWDGALRTKRARDAEAEHAGIGGRVRRQRTAEGNKRARNGEDATTEGRRQRRRGDDAEEEARRRGVT